MKPQELKIESEAFENLRRNMNIAINAVMNNLVEKNLPEGAVTAKIDINLFKQIERETAEVIYKPVFTPDVSFKIGSKLKVECAEVGGLIMKQGPNGRNVVASEQMSVDDLLDALREENER